MADKPINEELVRQYELGVKRTKENNLLKKTEADPNSLPERSTVARAWSRIKEIFGAGDSIQDTMKAYEARKQQVEKIKIARGLAAEVSQKTRTEIEAAGRSAKKMGLDASVETAKLTAEEQATQAKLDRETDELDDEWFKEGIKSDTAMAEGRTPTTNLEESSAGRTLAMRKETQMEKVEVGVEEEKHATAPDLDIQIEAMEPEEAPTDEAGEKTQVFTRGTAEASESKTKIESKKVNTTMEQLLEKSRQISTRIDSLTNNKNLKEQLDVLQEELENHAMIILYKKRGLQKLETDEPIMLGLLTEFDTELANIEQQITKQEAEATKIEAQINEISRHMPEQVKSQVKDQNDQRKLADEARLLLDEWNKIDTVKSGGQFVDHFSNPRQLEQASLQALKIREQEQAIRQDNAEVLAGLTEEESAAIVTEARKKIFSWDEADKDKPGFTSHFDNPYQRQEAVRQIMAERGEKIKMTEAKEKEAATEKAATQPDEKQQPVDDEDDMEQSDPATQTANLRRVKTTKETAETPIKSKTTKELEEGVTEVDIKATTTADTEIDKTDTINLQTIKTGLLNADRTAHDLRLEVKGLGGKLKNLTDDYFVGIGMLMKRWEALDKSPTNNTDNTKALTALKTDWEKMQVRLLQLELEIKVEQLKKDANQANHEELSKQAEELAGYLQKVRPIHEDALVEDVKIFAENTMERINRLREKLIEDIDTDRDTINDITAMKRHREATLPISESNAQLDWNEYEPAEGEEDKILDILGFNENSSLGEIASFRQQIKDKMDKLTERITEAKQDGKPNISTDYEEISLRVLKNVDKLLYRAQLMKETKSAAA